MAVLQVNRQEIKYPISLLEFKKLERTFLACLKRDPYAGESGSYKVRSLYLDTPLEKDRMDVLRGGETRRKIRLRVYSPQDLTVKLEMKAKEGKFQRKTSVTLSRQEAQSIIQGDFSVLRGRKEPEAQHLRLALEQGMYRPRVLVEYDRTAFFLPMGDIRVTFDHNAVASRTNLDLFSRQVCWSPLRPASVGVLEVKFNGFLPSYLQDALQNLDHIPSANGKYLYACNL